MHNREAPEPQNVPFTAPKLRTGSRSGGRIAAALILALSLPAALGAHAGADVRIAALSRQIAEAPRDARLYLARGELHRVRRAWSRAVSDYDRAAALAPRMAAVDLCRGTLWLQAGRPDRARLFLARFLRKEPEHSSARVLLARAQAGAGRSDVAARELSRAIDLDPQPRPEHYLELVKYLEEAGRRREEALAALDHGVARLGPVVTLELAAVDLELDLGRTEHALARIDLLAAQAQIKAPWTLRRGEILERSGRCQEARLLYAGALAAWDASPGPGRGAAAVAALEHRLLGLPSADTP